MALLWGLVAVVAAAGAGMLLLQVRALGRASDELRAQLRLLAELRVAAHDVRTEAARTAALARRVRGAPRGD